MTPKDNTLDEKIDDERLARQFHDIYERLAPSFGYETPDDTRQFDPKSPNGKLMIAVAHEVNQSIHQLITDEVLGVLEELKQYNGAYIGIDGRRVENMLHHDVITKIEERYRDE
jgi:hypothetical protein